MPNTKTDPIISSLNLFLILFPLSLLFLITIYNPINTHKYIQSVGFIAKSNTASPTSFTNTESIIFS